VLDRIDEVAAPGVTINPDDNSYGANELMPGPASPLIHEKCVAMADWTSAQLAVIHRAGELRVAAHRADGTLRPSAIVWHVVVDGQLYIRSVRGEDGALYRAARRTGTGAADAGPVHAEVRFTTDDSCNEAIDRAYRVKYGNGSPVRAITSPTATATTLRIDRRNESRT